MGILTLVPGDRGALGKLADRVRKESPLPLFPYRGELPIDDRIVWDGKDPAEFLRLAKEGGAKMLYLNEAIVPENPEEPELANHVGETSLVEIGYLLDGTFHTFLEVAPWAEAPTEDSEEGGDHLASGLEETAKGESLAEDVLRKGKDELVRDFMAEFEKGLESIEPAFRSVDASLRRFLAPKLSTEGYHLFGISHDGSGLDSLVQAIAREISADLLAKERARIEPLIPECISWAKGLGIRSLSKSDVDAFLLERAFAASSEGRRLLWTQAKLAVKVGR